MNKRARLTQINLDVMGNSLPEDLMKDVYWAFSGEAFPDLNSFSAKVREYQIAIKKKDDWDSQKEVFPQSSIQIYYDYWANDEEEVEEVFELKADNGESFTASELLFKIHNTVIENVRRGDHIFFEGLTLSDSTHDDKPFYWMHLGS